MKETINLNGTEEGGVSVPGVADAAADEIRKAQELLRANGYVLFGYREAGEKIKQATISGLDFVKCKWKDFGEWLSAKRAEMKDRSDAAAEKRRLAEEAEARRAEAESAREEIIAERQSVVPGDVPKCTACGAELVPGARFCRKCGKPVSAVRDTPTAEPTAEAKSVSASDEDPVGSAVVKCAACGAALAAGMKFCGECGTPVNAGASKPRKRKASSPRKNSQGAA